MLKNSILALIGDTKYTFILYESREAITAFVGYGQQPNERIFGDRC